MTTRPKKISLFHLPTLVNPIGFLISEITLPQKMMKAKYSSYTRDINSFGMSCSFEEIKNPVLFSPTLTTGNVTKIKKFNYDKIVNSKLPNIERKNIFGNLRDESTQIDSTIHRSMNKEKHRNQALPKILKKGKSTKKLLKPANEISFGFPYATKTIKDELLQQTSFVRKNKELMPSKSFKNENAKMVKKFYRRNQL